MSNGNIITGPIIKELIGSAPKGLSKLVTWFNGKKLVIVGPPRSGKTQLFEFLQIGSLADEMATLKTMKHQFKRILKLSFGKQSGDIERERRSLLISAFADTAGQMGPLLQAEFVFKENPHGIIIVTDLSKPVDELKEWLEDFYKQLSDYWRKARDETNRLSAMIVVLNKFDKASYEKAKTIEIEFKKVIKDYFGEHARGKLPDTDHVDILISILVRNLKGPELAAERIVDRLFRRLT